MKRLALIMVLVLAIAGVAFAIPEDDNIDPGLAVDRHGERINPGETLAPGETVQGGPGRFAGLFKKNPVTEHQYLDFGASLDRDRPEAGMLNGYAEFGIFNVKEPSAVTTKTTLFAQAGHKMSAQQILAGYSLYLNGGVRFEGQRFDLETTLGYEDVFSTNALGDKSGAQILYLVDFKWHAWGN